MLPVMPQSQYCLLSEQRKHRDGKRLGHIQLAQICIGAEVMTTNLIATVCKVITKPFESHVEAVNCHHNHVQRVHEMLFELVTLDAAFTLGDIFRLMERSPLLQQVFFREFAEELCGEARKGPIVGVAARASLEHIEYLELYQQWGLDTSTQVYSSTQRLHLHGVGPELTEDAPDHSRQRGQRVQWSLSLAPLRELLPFPLRVNAEVQVVEDDVHAKAHHREIARARHPDVTLGQVIHGVLWELSFHGGPQEQAQVADELHQQVAAIDAGTAELVSGDDFFDDLDRPGCEALFEDLGGQSVRDISHALRDIEDDENAAAWIEKAFDGLVRVKPQFRDRTGREFRKAFRAAAR